MGYTNLWSDASPLGSASANTIATLIRSVKTDLEQRVGDLFALPLTGGVVVSATFAADPLRAYGIRLTDAQDGVIYLGDNTGTPRALAIKDKTGATTYLTIDSTLLTGLNFKSIGGGSALSMVSTSSGTYGSAEGLTWYRANGSTVRTQFGYLTNNTQTFSLATVEAGGLIVLQSGNGVTALTIDANQKILIGQNGGQASYAAYINNGDATALEPTWGLSSAALILGINSSLTVPAGNSVYLHAHLLTKVTAANSASVQGLETWTWASHTSGTVGSLFGLIGNLAVSGVGGTVTNTFALTGGVVVSGGTVTNAYGLLAGVGTVNGASSVVTTGYGIRVQAATLSNSGTIGTQYGIYINDITGGGTNNIALFLAGANDSIFNGSGVALATNATKGFIFIPSTTNTPTGVPDNAGTGRVAFHYDTGNNRLCVYNGAWKVSAVLT